MSSPPKRAIEPSTRLHWSNHLQVQSTSIKCKSYFIACLDCKHSFSSRHDFKALHFLNFFCLVFLVTYSFPCNETFLLVELRRHIQCVNILHAKTSFHKSCMKIYRYKKKKIEVSKIFEDFHTQYFQVHNCQFICM